jgi:hypothetical protein
VADAFAVKVHIGGGGEGNVGKSSSGHGGWACQSEVMRLGIGWNESEND